MNKLYVRIFLLSVFIFPFCYMTVHAQIGPDIFDQDHVTVLEAKINPEVGNIIRRISNEYGQLTDEELGEMNKSLIPSDATAYLDIFMVPIMQLPRDLFAEDNWSHRLFVMKELAYNFEKIFGQVTMEEMFSLWEKLKAMGHYDQQELIPRFVWSLLKKEQTIESETKLLNKLGDLLPLGDGTKVGSPTDAIIAAVHKVLGKDAAIRLIDNILNQQDLNTELWNKYKSARESLIKDLEQKDVKVKH